MSVAVGSGCMRATMKVSNEKACACDQKVELLSAITSAKDDVPTASMNEPQPTDDIDDDDDDAAADDDNPDDSDDDESGRSADLDRAEGHWT